MIGTVPPAEPIFDYNKPIKFLNERMPCKKCGKVTGAGVTDSINYTHEYIDTCLDCLWIATFVPLTKQIVVSDD